MSELESGPDDPEVEYYADGYSEAVQARAETCAHRVFNWQLDQDAGEWRRECIFCPAVLETRPTEGGGCDE